MSKSKYITLFFIGWLLSFHCEAQIFVDKESKGLNDGSSWQNAFTTIQAALDQAEESVQVWIAHGTYLPGDSGDPISSTFRVSKGVQLYGGFAGTESHLSDRIPKKFPTILSGDLKQDDITDDFEVNRTDNVLTIMHVENNTSSKPLIDGFTFIGGHAAEDVEYNAQSQGGALFLFSPAIIRNCTFLQNYSGLRGGAIFYRDSISSDNVSKLVIERCQFENNRSTYGGAINIRSLNNKLDTVQVRNSRFTNNRSKTYGGGIVLFLASDNSVMLVDSCHFIQNTSNVSMGGIYGLSFGESSSLIVKNSTFEKNDAHKFAGAIELVARKSSVNNKLIIEDCSFEENRSYSPVAELKGGGAVYILPQGTGTLASISHSVFNKNTTNGWGGAMAIVTGSESRDNRVEIDSCLFKDQFSDCGGAILYMSIGSNDSLYISNSEFIGNSIEDVYGGLATKGGAIHLDYTFLGKTAYNNIQNCLFENNINKTGDGGAISVTPVRGGTFTGIYNSIFKGNSSAGKGGAFNYSGIDKAYEIEGCTFENNYASITGTHIHETPSFDKSLFYIFFHGVLWVQILYSLLLFFISGERSTFYYMMLMIGISLFCLVIIDFHNIPFLNQIHLTFRLILMQVGVIFTTVGLLKFAQHYLRVYHFFPSNKKIVLYFLMAFIIIRVTESFFELNAYTRIDFNLKAALTIISTLMLLITPLIPVVWAIMVLRKDYSPAKYFIWTMLFLGAAVILFIVSYLEHNHFLDAPIILIQSLILMTIIGLGLADGFRINLLKKDKGRAERLAELDIAKTRLYNNITHEFRTPLTVIMGTSEMISGNEQKKTTYPSQQSIAVATDQPNARLV